MALSSRTDYPVTISLGNRKVTLHHTGEVYIGKSLRQLAGHLNLDPRAIEREASYGRDPYCGYLFKRGPAYGSKDFSGEH